jgi:hypothetical protein
MANQGTYAGIIGYDIYDPGNAFFSNRGLGAQLPTPDHQGVDYGTHGVTGIGVPAATGGVVTITANSSGFGMRVTVITSMPDGSSLEITYGHVKPVAGLSNGMYVVAGKIIGTVENASTLTSGGGTLTIPTSQFLPHLHLEIRSNGIVKDPYTFNNWSGFSHTVGTDPSGNIIIMQSTWSGGVQTDYMSLVKDGVTLHTYDTVKATSYDLGGHVLGSSVSAIASDNSTVIQTKLAADGSVVSQTFFGVGYTTTYQAGVTILTNTTMGTATVGIPGFASATATVNLDGSITVTPIDSGFTITIPSSPYSSITINAGGQAFTVPAGSVIQESGGAVLIQKVGESGYPSLLINPNGSATQFNIGSAGNFLGTTQIGNVSSQTNPIIFTLNTDTPNLKPANPDALGGTSGTSGLLGCGAGYDYFMLSDFVNKNGGAFVGATCITANGMRVGNLTPSTFDQIVNVIRNTVFTSSTISSNLLADAAQSLSLGYAYKTVPYIDPLTLDAGNDGVRLSAAPVNFDLNADGVAEALPWTAPTDPLLVMDVNGDGKINNGTELVDLTDSGKPLNLFRLDSNGDGVLNASDAAYWNLQLWQDRNQDGYASPEERQSLADTGIVSIDLNPAHLQTATVAGKANVKGVTATYTDGSTHILWDVPFDSATAATATSSSYAIGINKVSGSGQTALVAMSALGVTLDLNGSGADQAIGGAGNDTLDGGAGAWGEAANDAMFKMRRVG